MDEEYPLPIGISVDLMCRVVASPGAEGRGARIMRISEQYAVLWVPGHGDHEGRHHLIFKDRLLSGRIEKLGSSRFLFLFDEQIDVIEIFGEFTGLQF